MIFSRKKTSAIDRRLNELQREMARVDTELKTLARYNTTDSEASALKSAKPRFAGAGSEPEPVAKTAALSVGEGEKPPSRPEDLPSGEPEGGKTDSTFAMGDVKAGIGDMPLFEERKPATITGREKFANYFMAGHFSNLRPLRQEKRVIKNKAIIMVILVVLALIWLIFFLQ